MKKYIILFFTMLKIGLFTFGGGYAMIALLENEFVSKKKWLGDDEFADMIAVAESTPGPIAVNAATYIGYKVGKAAGGIICTVAVCIPSFVIIYLVSLFFDRFLQISTVASAFKGIQACVIFLIFSAGLNMFIKMHKTVFNIVLFIATAGCMVAFSLFAINFSSVFYILISGVAGLAVYLVRFLSERKKKSDEIGSKPEGGEKGEFPDEKAEINGGAGGNKESKEEKR